MIFTSLAVSAALIVTLVLNIVAGSWETDLTFVIGLITIAVVVFAGVVVIRLRKSEHVKKLDDNYYAEYERISDALGNSVMSRAEIKETKEDIVSLMLDAQSQGRPVEDVVGGDIKAFIRRIQDSFGYRSRFMFQLLSVLQYGIFFIALMQVLVYFEAGGRTGFFDVTISFNMMVMFLVLILVGYPITRNAMRKDRSVLPFVLPLGSGLAYIGLLILLDNTAYHLDWVKFFLDSEVGMIPSWWLLTVLLVVMAAAQGVKLYLRQRSIRTME